jgi:hypothetical protein
MLGYVRRRCGKAVQIREINFEGISNFIRGKRTGFTLTSFQRSLLREAENMQKVSLETAATCIHGISCS